MFNAVRVWIEHSRHDRMKVAGQLMGCVRFLHMPPEEIVRHVEPNVAYFAGLGGHDVLLGIYRCVGYTGRGVGVDRWACFRERGGGLLQREGWTGGPVLERGVDRWVCLREGGGQVGLF